MRLNFRALVSICMLLATTTAFGFDSPIAQDMYAQNGFDGRMLDASMPVAERTSLFAHMVALANAGQVQAQDVAGTLFWQGPQLAGSPVPRDLKQARTLLGNAAVRGDVQAMGKMGELELQAGNHDAAMVWTQLYAHYLNPIGQRANQHSRNTAYAADLMERIIAAGGAINDGVSKQVNAFVARFDGQIRDGMDAMRKAREHNDPHMIDWPQYRLTGKETNLNGVADYMVAFNASGDAIQIWTLASYPTADIAAATRAGMDAVRANPADTGTGTRYLHLTIPLNSRRKSVQIAH